MKPMGAMRACDRVLSHPVSEGIHLKGLKENVIIFHV